MQTYFQEQAAFYIALIYQNEIAAKAGKIL